MPGTVGNLALMEAKEPSPVRLFILRIRHADGRIEEATEDIVLREGDVLAVAGSRDALVTLLGANAVEVEDPELRWMSS
jgi:putative transport protein